MRSGRDENAGTSTTWNDQRGFTLIEIANVIMIISVLTLIGLPAISDSQTTVKRTSCAERQRRIFEAAVLYAAENIVPDGDINVSDLVPYYIHEDVAECPESASLDHDDYTITFFDGRPVDVNCDVRNAEHPWAPR